MESLSYKIMIKAPREQVWKIMLEPATYSQWTRAFSPNSKFDGDWIEGTHIRFIDPDMGGTMAYLETVRPFEMVLAKHVAMLGADGTEDTLSEEALKWIGAVEQYRFIETDGGTELLVDMQIHRDYVEMLVDAWPKALELLKDLCEGK
jgi:uncharacterized protein YndB with AHSA1/START domain